MSSRSLPTRINLSRHAAFESERKGPGRGPGVGGERGLQSHNPNRRGRPPARNLRQLTPSGTRGGGSMARMETLDPEIVRRLSTADKTRFRRVAIAVSEFALERANLQSPLAREALDSLRETGAVSP